MSYDVEQILTNLRQSTYEEMAEALSNANLPVLRACIYQLTGDERVRTIHTESVVGTSDRVGPPEITYPEDKQYLIDFALATLRKFRDGLEVPRRPKKSELLSQLALFVGHEIESDEIDYWWEEFAVEEHPRWPEPLATPPDSIDNFVVAIIGAGMSGISAAISMKAAGVPFVVLEKNSGIGGTWFENVYPGIRVDVASRAYTYTFEPDYPWKHYYATGDELIEYFDFCADKYAIRDQIRLSTEVVSATWEDSIKMWVIEVAKIDGSTETVRANLIVSAVGLFNRPKVANISGLNSFKGKILHTAQWDTEYTLNGKRVAIIGTGSSGVQLAGTIASEVESLTIFQRAGAWIAGVPNYTSEVSSSERWLLDNVPYYLNWVRLDAVYAIGDKRAALLNVDPAWPEHDTVSEGHARVRAGLMEYLKQKIGDRPDLLEKCIPVFPPLAKRLPKDNGWFDALRRENVELVTDPIATVNESGVRCDSGRQIDVDLIVVATGFHTDRYLRPIEWFGTDGVKLEEIWKPDGARAYLGMLIPNFPNLFCMYGPNTNGAGGPVPLGEMQMRYLAKIIGHLRSSGLMAVEVKRKAYDDYNKLLDERLKTTIWMDPRQTSYFLNEFGRVVTNGAFLNRENHQWTFSPNIEDLIFS